MFQSRHSWLWRAQPASRREALNQDVFSPPFAQNQCIFSKSAHELYQSLWVCSSTAVPGDGGSSPPTCRQTQAASRFPSPSSPAATVTHLRRKSPRDIIFLFWPNKPHCQITDTKAAGQIWKWSFKPQNEWREEITFQLFSPPQLGSKNKHFLEKYQNYSKWVPWATTGTALKRHGKREELVLPERQQLFTSTAASDGSGRA